jgi:hypothetical protein
MKQYIKHGVANDATTMKSGASLSCGEVLGRGKNGASPKRLRVVTEFLWRKSTVIRN